ncbi:MAG TPA: chorismate mutase [Dehalococcoidia bacterium]|jgi:chorismate mutase|nr:chorismate mutase [Dehalococcoidia bacterium]|tara:strand:+ start:305 stop:553 length:249 start_codon:yes stop_codon:yes gene_type:complete
METDKIGNLRKKIDRLDLELIKVIDKRQKIANEIVKIKIKNEIPIEDLKREKEIINQLSKKSKLSNEFIEDIFQVIFKKSKK